MKFIVDNENFFNGIRIVSGVATLKSVQPVLANILIETVDKGSVKLTATDLDITISTIVEAQVESEGSITLSSKKLNDIFSKLSEKLVTVELDADSNMVNIKNKNTKFELIGISAEEFPQNINVDNLEDNIDIELKTFKKAIKQAGFAAASYETTGILSGVVCDIKDEILEMASTDGNRLARVREKINNAEGKNSQLIIPSRTLQEFLKISGYLPSSEKNVKIYTNKSKIIIKCEKTVVVSKIMEGSYPQYNKLIPETSPKQAIIKKSELINALERVAIMVNERTNQVRFEFSEDKLILKSDAPDSGKSQEELDIEYKFEDLIIGFNYKYIIDGLKNMEEESISIGLNTSLTATIFKPNNEEDYISLIMPVQIR